MHGYKIRHVTMSQDGWLLPRCISRHMYLNVLEIDRWYTVCIRRLGMVCNDNGIEYYICHVR